MSTSAIVEVVGLDNIGFYVHWDGYPEHMLPWLTKFIEKFNKERGNDPQYCFAQLIRSSVLMQEEFNLNKDQSCGYGVVVPGDFGVNYNYRLDPGAGTVKIV